MTATVRSAVATFDTAAPPFRLAIDVGAGSVAIHGDFDREHAEAFIDAVRLLEYSPSPRWSIDVSAVAFCDAGGLRALLAARRLAELQGRTLRVTRAGRWMRRLLPMIGLSPARPPLRTLRPPADVIDARVPRQPTLPGGTRGRLDPRPTEPEEDVRKALVADHIP
jgi:anti-anti-sigma regulatory factor